MLRSRNRWSIGTQPRIVRMLAVGVLAAALTVSAGCSRAEQPTWHTGAPEPVSKASATITEPAENATNVPTSAEISFTTTDAVETTVTLTDESGKAVKGSLSADGTTWRPAKQLAWGTTYTATVTVTDSDGRTASTSRTFTTMTKPSKLVSVSSFLGDGAVVGVGMPMIVRFSRAVPEEYRDDVQRRMTLRSDPPQEGIWHWVSGTEVRYRPKEFWKAGTKIHYEVRTGGLPLGDGWYAANDLTVDLSIGSSTIMVVDNKTKTMTVYQDGKVTRTMPVSLGKPKTPSSSGTMVVMEKHRKTVFDTYDELGPEEGYRIDIEYAQRLTWGGEFIHSAPWSVADQGVRNVSHGCVNLSPDNARWLFNQTKIGDPVTVKGTEVKLKHGNGWTDWNLSWEEYVKGSALPYQPSQSRSTA